MNRFKLAAAAAIALTLAGCSGVPTWNTAVFPQQPEYSMDGNTQTAKAEVPVK